MQVKDFSKEVDYFSFWADDWPIDKLIAILNDLKSRGATDIKIDINQELIEVRALKVDHEGRNAFWETEMENLRRQNESERIDRMEKVKSGLDKTKVIFEL